MHILTPASYYEQTIYLIIVMKFSYIGLFAHHQLLYLLDLQ